MAQKTKKGRPARLIAKKIRGGHRLGVQAAGNSKIRWLTKVYNGSPNKHRRSFADLHRSLVQAIGSKIVYR